MKQLRKIGKEGEEIDFDVLKTFTAQEWREWINSRLSGRDVYGFAVGGTHARVEPSDGFGYIADKISAGESYPEAEKAISEMIVNHKPFGEHFGYYEAELLTIAKDVTRPYLGYNDITKKVAGWVRQTPLDKRLNSYELECLEDSLATLNHMQKFADTRFRDIYSKFLDSELLTKIAKEGWSRKMLAREAFFGRQVAYPLFTIDKEAVLKIMEINKGDGRELEVVFRVFGGILEDKFKAYFQREKLLEEVK